MGEGEGVGAALRAAARDHPALRAPLLEEGNRAVAGSCWEEIVPAWGQDRTHPTPDRTRPARIKLEDSDWTRELGQSRRSGQPPIPLL